MIVHYFWVLCEDGQEGKHSLDFEDVTCEKCIKQVVESDYVQQIVADAEVKRRMDKREDNTSA